MTDSNKNSWLVLLIVVLIAGTLLANRGAEFSGTDGQATQIISEIDPGYQPWFKNVWEPPSREIESLLFAMQAAIGTGFICFYLGYKAGKKKRDGEV